MGSIEVTQVKDGRVFQWHGRDAQVAESCIGELFAEKAAGTLPWNFVIIAHDLVHNVITIKRIDLPAAR